MHKRNIPKKTFVVSENHKCLFHIPAYKCKRSDKPGYVGATGLPATRMIIYLGLLLPTASSDLPGNRSGKPIVSYLVLLRMGFTCALLVTLEAVVSYTAFPPLLENRAVYFCCTGLGVTSTGRYPASCPVKPGLSSPPKTGPRSFAALAVSLYT